MTTTAQLLIGIITAFAASGSLIIFFIFYNLNKRIKQNEADRSEIDNLKIIIEEIGKDRDATRTDRDALRSDVNRLEKRINDFEVSYIEIEKENHIYKRAGNAGYGCEVEREKCPIHLKFYELKNSRDETNK